MICQICNIEIPDNKFGHHLKSHSIKLADYFYKYHPRNDLYTNSPIEFKSKEYYFSTNFNSRGTMISYLKNKSREETQKAAIEQLRLRKEYKNLIYAPSFVETKSAILPTPQAFKMVGLNYEAICLDLGLKLKYDYNLLPEFQAVDDFICLIDSREQLPLDMSIKTVKTALDFGDLTLKSDKIEFNKVFIERKSLNDLIGTMSGGYDRFKRELDRCKAFGGYLIVTCEKDLETVLHFDESKWYGKFTKASSKFIFGRVRDLMQEYDCLQFCFVDGRKAMVDLIMKIFSAKTDIKKCDLQYLIAEKRI